MMALLDKIRKYASRWFIMGNLHRPIMPFRVNLLYWISDDGRDNVGDYLSKIVLQYCLSYFGIFSTKSFRTKRICLIGSVLSFIGGVKPLSGVRV